MRPAPNYRFPLDLAPNPLVSHPSSPFWATPRFACDPWQFLVERWRQQFHAPLRNWTSTMTVVAGVNTSLLLRDGKELRLGRTYRNGLHSLVTKPRHRRPSWNDCESRASRNSPSFAVTLNWGMGSSSLNAEVTGWRDSRWFAPGIPHTSARSRGRERCGQDVWVLRAYPRRCLVDDDLGGDVRQFTSLPCVHLLSHEFKVALHSVDADRDAIDERERLRVFRQHRCKDCSNAKGNFHFERTVRYRRSNDEDQKRLE
jgi:hypothetical protein